MAYEGVVTGVVTGTGATLNVECGFTPSRVQLINDTGIILEWTPGLGAGYGIKIQASGTTLITTLGVSTYVGVTGTNSEGFTIGADLDINVDTEPITWTAFY
jgi:hypothetical protein